MMSGAWGDVNVFRVVFTDVEKEKSGSLESVSASLYDSISVPDLSDYLVDYASSNAATPNSETSSTSSSTTASKSHTSNTNTSKNSDSNQVSSTTKSSHSISSNGVVLSEGKCWNSSKYCFTVSWFFKYLTNNQLNYKWRVVTNEKNLSYLTRSVNIWRIDQLITVIFLIHESLKKWNVGIVICFGTQLTCPPKSSNP